MMKNAITGSTVMYACARVCCIVISAGVGEFGDRYFCH